MSEAVQHRGRTRPELDRPALVALLLGLAGVGYRLVMMLLTVPSSNSDEATFGLAAMHIADRREWPIFLYGQRYMGVLESYLAAPLIAAFGPSWPVLRIPLLVLYALFVYLVYRLARRLYSPWFATFIVGLLALGSERVVRDQMTAVGGRPEVKAAVVLLLLIAFGLAERTIRRRRLAIGLFGLVVGLATWSDWLILPYLAVAGLVLLYAAHRDLLGWAGALLVAGFALGALPMLRDNLIAPPGEDSLSVFRKISAGTGSAPPLIDRLRGGLLEGVPLATGLCPIDGCARWQEWFGLLYPVLLAAAAVLALVAYRRAAGGSARQRIRPVTQLALVAGAGLTLLGYVRSSLAATGPLENARYLSVLQISLPAVLWPLWLAAAASWRGAVGAAGRLAGALATAVLAALTASALVATGLLITDSGDIRAEERQARAVAAALRRDGPHEVYGDYWTCNRLIFNTSEEVICAVLDDDLTPGRKRYRAYWQQVGRADQPGYVFEAGSRADRRLAALLEQRAIPTTVIEVGGYRVYHPETAVRPWR